MLQEFESVTDLGEFEIKIGNRVFRRLHLWACYNLKMNTNLKAEIIRD